jgi:hypothetical protein
VQIDVPPSSGSQPFEPAAPIRKTGQIILSKRCGLIGVKGNLTQGAGKKRSAIKSESHFLRG